MQQFVDDGEEITKNEFIFAVGDIIDSFSDIEFPVEYYKNGNIYWIYDSMDIHWFFESEDYSDKSIKEAFTEASSEDIIVYHVTERRNRKSILEKGLIPKLGARSRQVEVGGKYVHVFLTTDALEDAFSSWIEDAFDEEKPLIVLELRVPKYWVKEDPAYPESVGLIDRIIPPNRIQMSKIQIEESAGIRESIEKITAIVSGSFKPPHKGHWQMVKYFSAKADKCVVIVSDPQKDESKRLTDAGEVITPEQVIDIFKIYAENDEVDNVIFKVAVSPVTEALRYIDEYAERGETILLGVSNKGDDEKRYKNIDKYSPDGVKVIVDVFDAITLDGEELSSSDFRDSIGSGDIDRFLPDLSPENKQRVKEIL
jgi:cytidyltransferase-like protein